MIAYQTKKSKLPGTNYKEIKKEAEAVLKIIRHRTKRKPYIRSAYFKKDKIFFDNLWIHIFQKRDADRVRRLKFLECALDLIRYSRNHPDSRQNPENKNEILHRFMGLSRENEVFFVQIKENKRTGTKQFMSVFPEK